MSNKNRNGHTVNPNRPTEVDIAAKVAAGLGTKDDVKKAKEQEAADKPEVKAKAEQAALESFVATWETWRADESEGWFGLAKACGNYFSSALHTAGRGDKDTYAGITAALIAKLSGPEASKGTVSRLLGTFGVMQIAAAVEEEAGEVDATAKTVGRAYWQQLVRLVDRDLSVGRLEYGCKGNVDADDVLNLLTEASKGTQTVKEVKAAVDALLNKVPTPKTVAKMAEGIAKSLASAKGQRQAVVEELGRGRLLSEQDYATLSIVSPEFRTAGLKAASRGELTAAIERLEAIANQEAAAAAVRAADERMTQVHPQSADMLGALLAV